MNHLQKAADIPMSIPLGCVGKIPSEWNAVFYWVKEWAKRNGFLGCERGGFPVYYKTENNCMLIFNPKWLFQRGGFSIFVHWLNVKDGSSAVIDANAIPPFCCWCEEKNPSVDFHIFSSEWEAERGHPIVTDKIENSFHYIVEDGVRNNLNYCNVFLKEDYEPGVIPDNTNPYPGESFYLYDRGDNTDFDLDSFNKQMES